MTKVEIHDLTRACLRENIAMVLQDTWVYKGTIGDNLKYGFETGNHGRRISGMHAGRPSWISL